MRTVQRDWDWWAYHFRVVHRGQIPHIDRWDDDLVEMIVDVLKLRPGDRVLDLACGSGAHALRLARRGLRVVGVDIAPSLVAHCRRQAAEGGITSARFEQGDMRDLNYEDEFDAVLLLSGSFGFFDDATNRDVLARMARALRGAEPVEPGAPGAVRWKHRRNVRAPLPGRILIDVFDPLEMVARPPRRTWSEFGGGYSLRCTWWEPETCTSVSEFMFLDAAGVLNTSAERERIRVYSLPEWRDLFATAGLTMTYALAETKLPLVPYDRDQYANLVIVGHRSQRPGLLRTVCGRSCTHLGGASDAETPPRRRSPWHEGAIQNTTGPQTGSCPSPYAGFQRRMGSRAARTSSSRRTGAE